jgi:hypothetical protein
LIVRIWVLKTLLALMVVHAAQGDLESSKSRELERSQSSKNSTDSDWSICFIQISCESLALELFFPHPHHEPRTFKSHIYALRLICTCSVAQALSITTFRFRKDAELTKLFKIAYRVAFRGRRPDFRDFKNRSKIACNFAKTKYFKNLKVGSDSP